jgi:hypothetical protein
MGSCSCSGSSASRPPSTDRHSSHSLHSAKHLRARVVQEAAPEHRVKRERQQAPRQRQRRPTADERVLGPAACAPGRQVAETQVLFYELGAAQQLQAAPKLPGAEEGLREGVHLGRRVARQRDQLVREEGGRLVHVFGQAVVHHAAQLAPGHCLARGRCLGLAHRVIEPSELRDSRSDLLIALIDLCTDYAAIPSQPGVQQTSCTLAQVRVGKQASRTFHAMRQHTRAFCEPSSLRCEFLLCLRCQPGEGLTRKVPSGLLRVGKTSAIKCCPC